MVVVDTEIIGYLFLQGERSRMAEQALQRDPRWCAPLLWRTEFCDILAHWICRDRLTEHDALRILNAAEHLMIGNEYTVHTSRAFGIALRSGCSAAHGEFVVLAQDLDTALVTCDPALIENHAEVAVSLEAFVEGRKAREKARR